MTDRLSEIKARRAKATPGHATYFYGPEDFCIVQIHHSKVFAHAETQEDAEAIAAAPADIDWLIAEVERLQAENDELQSELEQAERAKDDSYQHGYNVAKQGGPWI